MCFCVFYISNFILIFKILRVHACRIWKIILTLFLDTIQLENSESIEYTFSYWIWCIRGSTTVRLILFFIHVFFFTLCQALSQLNLLFLVSIPLSLHTMFHILNKSLFPLTLWLTLFTALLLKIPLRLPYFFQLLNWNTFHFNCTTKDKIN